MKRLFSKSIPRQFGQVLFAAALILLLGQPAAESAPSEDKPLLIFAAASLAPVLEDATSYLERRTGAEVSISYAASAVLARQIAAGAPADIFISADRRWIEWLTNNDVLSSEEAWEFARNRLVVAAGGGLPESATRDPALFLSQSQTIATADPEIAPLGRYAQEAIESLGLSEALRGRLMWAQDARSALALVETGAAEAGILYASDAAGSRRIAQTFDIPADRHTPIVYLALLLADDRPGAHALIRALRGDGMAAYLERNGLQPPENR